MNPLLVVKEGHAKASVNKEFQLSRGIIKKWLDAYEAHRTDKQAVLEQRQLEKENKLLKRGNDFLKKATAFFAKNQNLRDLRLFTFTIKNSGLSGCASV